MITQKYPILGSSANPEQISLTIKSMGVWLVPMALAIAKMAGVELVEADLVQAVNLVATIVAGVMTLYGLGRKLFYTIKK